MVITKVLIVTALVLRIACGITVVAAEPAKEPVDFINPMIGASTNAAYGEGKTFPGAARPFGLVQLSPDTTTGGDNGPGYSYEHPTIEGFSFTHMSGVGWYGDLGNFQVMPTTGPLQTKREDNASPFSHDDEIAQAGYYAVGLKRTGIRAEMSAAPRAGMLRFTFPAAGQGRLQIDLARRIGENCRWKKASRQSITMVDDRTIAGSMFCPYEDGGWGRGGGRCTYTLHFYAQFSKAPTAFGIWDKDEVFKGRKSHEGRDVGFFAEFATTAGEQIMLKAGVSFVSIEGAKANLADNLDHWDFERLRREARAAWATAVEGLTVEGGSDAQKEAFFTALYHVMIDPRAGADVDGTYIGGDGKPHRSPDFTYRTVFSGWDVFRSQFPLLTVIAPGIVNDEVNSLVQLAELSGRGTFGRWDLLNCDSGCMVGSPAISVAADAYLKGIRGFDAEKAFAIGKRTADQVEGKPGWSPNDVSWILENAYFDHCMARWAEALGKRDEAHDFSERAQHYRNIFDPGVNWMHARRADGTWTPWQGRHVHGQGCVESNPFQQGWFVPHDVQGLINLLGRERFLADLEEFFAKTPLSFKWNDYYNHANEPVHHVPYLFTYAGAPWLTQKWTRTVMDHAYGPGVKGLCGNDDVGQMSAWYVLSALGLHPVSPVDGIFLIGSPLFTRASVRLDPKYHRGKLFTVVAKDNAAENIYVQSASLNGAALTRSWLRYGEITDGGTLELVMGAQPNQAWGSARQDLPPSLSGELEYAAPVLSPASASIAKDFTARVTVRNRGPGPAVPFIVLREGERLFVSKENAVLAPNHERTEEVALRFDTDGAHAVEVFGKRSASVDVIDDQPPRLAQVALGANRTQVVATFSEPLDTAPAAAPANYRLDADQVPRSVTLSADGRTVSLAFANEVTAGTHILKVTGIADRSRAKNVLASAESGFSLVEAVVTTARTDKDWNDLPMGAPSADDYADVHAKHHVNLSSVPGFTVPHGGESNLRKLLDGVAAGSDDDTGRCVWMDGPARIVMDLGSEVPVAGVRVFSWHKGDRAPQKYVFYGSAGATMPDATMAAPGLPWACIAAVDTTKLGQGGKHASSIIGVAGKAIGTYRWLLWILEPVADGGKQGSFLTEVDVTVVK
ncbi:MAG: GH92 family glycosyl hydrolase [Planctomycetota bacterium]|nr:GH92 family glycosyl hydrolase [Planctomycetota bacterium]